MNPNDPNNVIATFFGYCKDGTSWLFDVCVTMVMTATFLGVIDWFLLDDLQANHPVLTNTVIIVPGAIFAVYIWRRASADNRRRKETGK